MRSKVTDMIAENIHLLNMGGQGTCHRSHGSFDKCGRYNARDEHYLWYVIGYLSSFEAELHTDCPDRANGGILHWVLQL
jgi:hypothetical protein